VTRRRVAAVAVAAVGAAFTAHAAPKSPASGDAAAGATLFTDRCVTCHVPAGGGQGPSLVTVFGRPAGAAPGFHYSAALAGSGLTWTDAELDRFLAGPSKLVPGTAMQVVIANPAQRADLIRYLATQKR
jgi:cytochrome c2